jgi:hypothetical protein
MKDQWNVNKFYSILYFFSVFYTLTHYGSAWAWLDVGGWGGQHLMLLLECTFA